MKLMNLVRTFRNDESGAVTVDWVVLTAAIVGIGIAVLGAVGGGIGSLTDQINTDLTESSTGAGSDAITAATTGSAGG